MSSFLHSSKNLLYSVRRFRPNCIINVILQFIVLEQSVSVTDDDDELSVDCY